LHESGSSNGDLGSYIFDLSKSYKIGSEECSTTQVVDSSVELVISVDDSSTIPDVSGYIVFGFGTSKEELVPYISRPSSTSLIVNPSYRFKFTHESGTNISLVSINSVYDLNSAGKDYPFYLTDIVSGRIYTEELIRTVIATGIKLAITILYPSDIGLGKGGTINSEIASIFGPDPV
jgi:hypothetical protein